MNKNDSIPSNSCLPDDADPLTHGYWHNGVWESLVCRTYQWNSRNTTGHCLRNKQVFLLGDSTTRQWYVELMKLLGEDKKLSGSELEVKKKYVSQFNLTIYWHFHPWTIGLGRKFIDNLKYEVDILDEINTESANCSDLVIVLSPWAHFTQWKKSAYVERLELLKYAVQRLMSRCGAGSLPFVVIRGPHSRLSGTKTPPTLLDGRDYILYKMNGIMRRTFRGVGAHYLDIWDMNMAYPSHKTIHMPAKVIRQEVSMMLSYLCNQVQ